LDDLARDPSLDTVEGRRQQEPRIHARIAEAVASRGAASLDAALRDAGVAAAPVLDCAELLEDEHLRARGCFETIRHPEESGIGARPYAGRPWRLSNVDRGARGPAPRFGEHTGELLAELGVGPEAVAELTADGVTPA